MFIYIQSLQCIHTTGNQLSSVVNEVIKHAWCLFLYWYMYVYNYSVCMWFTGTCKCTCIHIYILFISGFSCLLIFFTALSLWTLNVSVLLSFDLNFFQGLLQHMHWISFLFSSSVGQYNKHYGRLFRQFEFSVSSNQCYVLGIEMGKIGRITSNILLHFFIKRRNFKFFVMVLWL